MKTGTKILLILLAVLLVVIAVLLFWQRENLKALQTARNLSQEEIEQELSRNDSEVKKAVEAYPEISVRTEITEEEKRTLQEGTLSPEELAERLVEPEKTADEKKPEPVSEEPEPDLRLSALAAELLVLRETYLIELDNMMAEAVEEYAANGYSASELVKFAGRFMARAVAMEKEADRKVDHIVSEMREVIRETDGDPGLIDTVIETYANEKCLKKAWYMEKLEERGLIG